MILSICSLNIQPCKERSNRPFRGSYCEVNDHASKAKETNSAIRLLIRLLVLYQHDRLTDNQWQAILALHSHKVLIEQSQGFDGTAFIAEIRFVNEVIKDVITISEKDLQELYWRVSIILHEP